MAFFALCSDITIGSFRFCGVHDVRVKRSIHSHEDSAVISLPALCRIRKGNKDSLKAVAVSDQFKENDEVTINLGYNNEIIPGGAVTPVRKWNEDRQDGYAMYTVFRGFVRKVVLGNPVQVECEGYVRKLRLDVSVKKFRSAAKVSEVLKLLETGKNGPTGITIDVRDDIDLMNLKLSNCNGVEVIEEIKRVSQGVLGIFFIEPARLWCGLTYTPFSKGDTPFALGEITYKVGHNVVRTNTLTLRKSGTEKVKIVISGTNAAGKKMQRESGDKDAKCEKKVIVNGIAGEDGLKLMAKELQFRENYSGYEGSITGFLQPWCEPGWLVNIIDSHYPAWDGKYLVEATEVTFGTNGARIKVDVGPGLGFGNK